MSAPNKERLIARLLSTLTKQYPPEAEEEYSVLDYLLLGVLMENSSNRRARDLFRQILSSFHNLNELRVSHPKEIEDLLGDLADKQEKAKRILKVLQFVFETTYTFDLESMRKKPIKQAQKQLSKITGATDFAVAVVVQRSLGGHAIPLDPVGREALTKLKLLEPELTHEQARSTLEHLIAKPQGKQFSYLLSEWAADRKQFAGILGQLTGDSKRKPSTSAKSAEKMAAPAKSTTAKKPTKRKA